MLLQPLKGICLVMAQEMALFPRLNKHSGPISADDLAKKVGSDQLLIGRLTRSIPYIEAAES